MRLTGAAAYVIAGILFSGCATKDNGAPDAAVESQHDAEPRDAEEAPDVGLPPPEVCPRGAGTPVLGDINGDGVLDLADPIALDNHLFRAGAAPACRQAADWNNDGRVEVDDGHRAATYLVTGAWSARALNAHACDSATHWPEGQCAPLAIDLHAQGRVTTASFNAALAIRSPVLAVQGWSASLFAEGCRILSVTVEDTSAAEVWDDPPGLRHLGYSASIAKDDGAMTATILSFDEDITLPSEATILNIGLDAVVPSSGCNTCVVSAGDGISWTGRPIDLVIVAGGHTYRPEAPSISVDVCAP